MRAPCAGEPFLLSCSFQPDGFHFTTPGPHAETFMLQSDGDGSTLALPLHTFAFQTDHLNPHYKTEFMRTSLIPFIFSCTILFSGCSKNSDPGGGNNPEPEEPGTPAITAKGQPDGSAPAQKTIGAAGGTLASIDGKLTLTVPAGHLQRIRTSASNGSVTRIPRRPALRTGCCRKVSLSPSPFPLRSPARMWTLQSMPRIPSGLLPESQWQLVEVARHYKYYGADRHRANNPLQRLECRERPEAGDRAAGTPRGGTKRPDRLS